MCWNANVKTRWNHWKVSRKPQEKAKETLEHALNWLMSLWKKNANRSSSGRSMASCSWDKTSARTTSPSTQDDCQEVVAWQRKSELFMFYKDCLFVPFGRMMRIKLVFKCFKVEWRIVLCETEEPPWGRSRPRKQNIAQRSPEDPGESRGARRNRETPARTLRTTRSSTSSSRSAPGSRTTGAAWRRLEPGRNIVCFMVRRRLRLTVRF